MAEFKKGQRVVITGTVEWVQEGYQHRDYVSLKLDGEVAITGPDGSGASGTRAQVDLEHLRRMNSRDDCG